MAQIVKCSLLKRAGDVGYKTKSELEKGVPDLVGRYRKSPSTRRGGYPARTGTQFAAVARDPERQASARDAHHRRRWGDHESTLPHGTNYIRNTKLELWFSRLMRTASDLRHLHDKW